MNFVVVFLADLVVTSIVLLYCSHCQIYNSCVRIGNNRPKTCETYSFWWMLQWSGVEHKKNAFHILITLWQFVISWFATRSLSEDVYLFEGKGLLFDFIILYYYCDDSERLRSFCNTVVTFYIRIKRKKNIIKLKIT